MAMASAMAADADQVHADLVVAGPEHAAWDSEAEWVSAVKVADLAADLTAVDQDAESLVVEASRSFRGRSLRHLRSLEDRIP